jgi:hypothetical protein
MASNNASPQNTYNQQSLSTFTKLFPVSSATVIRIVADTLSLTQTGS